MLRGLQGGEGRVFRSGEIRRTPHARRVRRDHLRAAPKGGLVPWAPEVRKGDPTPVFPTSRVFCAAPLEHRFEAARQISADVSMMAQTAAMRVLPRGAICASDGATNTLVLPVGVSLHDLRQPMPPADATSR